MNTSMPSDFVQELLVLLLQPHALDLVGGAEALVQLGAVAQVLQLHLGEGAALAGLHMVDLHRDPEPVIVLEHVAGRISFPLIFGMMLSLRGFESVVPALYPAVRDTASEDQVRKGMICRHGTGANFA
jgi:hypothetical protein